MAPAESPGGELVTTAIAIDLDRVRDTVSRVVDPEIPVLTIADLGILREVAIEDGTVVVTITPTYSGCPAISRIESDIRRSVVDQGWGEVDVRVVQHPAWSTDAITGEGRRKLAEFGIAPPAQDDQVLCPRCESAGPRMVARFGSTACKALMVCSRCGEPFDYFKVYR